MISHNSKVQKKLIVQMFSSKKIVQKQAGLKQTKHTGV